MNEPAPPDWDRFRASAAELGVCLASGQVHRLQRYLDLLCDWNRRFNLTAIEDPQEILVKHFLDSLTCATVVDLARQHSLIDVGAGAGFPGLVLKIAFPHLRVTLLDSLRKRVGFLERVTEELDLKDLKAIHARAEDAARAALDSRPGRVRKGVRPEVREGLREAFDVVTARAVARLAPLVEWTLPFARVGGLLVAMKGPDVAGEVEEAARAIRLLGGGEPQITEFRLPGTDLGRSLLAVPKVRRTPPEYPRLPGSARKAPL